MDSWLHFGYEVSDYVSISNIIYKRSDLDWEIIPFTSSLWAFNFWKLRKLPLRNSANRVMGSACFPKTWPPVCIRDERSGLPSGVRP